MPNYLKLQTGSISEIYEPSKLTAANWPPTLWFKLVASQLIHGRFVAVSCRATLYIYQQFCNAGKQYKLKII